MNVPHQGNAALSEAKKQEVLDWLFKLASVNHYAIHSETYAKLAPNTASWILCEPKFDGWLSEEFDTFWGVGIPGAGKTVLTSYVINYLQERATVQGPDRIVLFAYCRFNDLLDTAKILCSLLGQLSEAYTPALLYIHEKLHSPCEQKKITPTENDLITCIQYLACQLPTKVFIAIDALDELQHDVREKLIDILISMKQSLFLTSRELSLSQLAASDIRIHAPTQDLVSFVAYRARALPRLWSLLENRIEVLDELTREVSSRSDGMFPLAALQLSALGGVTTIQTLRKAISALPSELTDVYELTLDRITKQSEEESNLARRAILWITYAFRPLKIPELLRALAIELESTELGPVAMISERTLISVCHGLLMIENKTGIVRLTHYTAYDFFLSSQGLFDKPHSFAATICAIHISHSQNGYHEASFPFNDYARRGLGHHTSRSSVECAGEIPHRVYALLSPNLRLPLSHPNMELTRYNDIHTGSIVHFAALHGILSILQMNTQDFNQKSSPDRCTPLWFATMGGHAAAVELLLQKTTVDINYVNSYAETVLILACQMGFERIVQLLLGCYGIDVNSRPMFEDTPLHRACESGHEAVVGLLLSAASIDVNARGRFEATALTIACMNAHDPIVRMLLGFSETDVNIPDSSGSTPLHYAARKGHASTVQLLLDSPSINFNARDRESETALHHACDYRHLSVVQLLLSCSGIDINAGAEDSRDTALHLAVRNRGESIVRLLVSFPGIDVNVRGYGGDSALLLACRSSDASESLAIIQLLLGCDGIDVNAQDMCGCTALHHASESGHEPVVRMLLNSGINVDTQNSWGSTALRFAESNEHRSIVDLLLPLSQVPR